MAEAVVLNSWSRAAPFSDDYLEDVDMALTYDEGVDEIHAAFPESSNQTYVTSASPWMSPASLLSSSFSILAYSSSPFSNLHLESPHSPPHALSTPRSEQGGEYMWVIGSADHSQAQQSIDPRPDARMSTDPFHQPEPLTNRTSSQTAVQQQPEHHWGQTFGYASNTPTPAPYVSFHEDMNAQSTNHAHGPHYAQPFSSRDAYPGLEHAFCEAQYLPNQYPVDISMTSLAEGFENNNDGITTQGYQNLPIRGLAQMQCEAWRAAPGNIAHIQPQHQVCLNELHAKQVLDYDHRMESTASMSPHMMAPKLTSFSTQSGASAADSPTEAGHARDTYDGRQPNSCQKTPLNRPATRRIAPSTARQRQLDVFGSALPPALRISAGSAAVRNTKSSAPVNRGGRRTGLEPTARQEAADTRKAIACWRCTFQRDKCPREGVCKRCSSIKSQKAQGRLLGCIRSHLKDLVSYFLPKTMTDMHQLGEVRAFVNNNVRHWYSSEITVQLTCGCGPRINWQMVEFRPTNDELHWQLQYVTQANGVFEPAFRRSPPLAVRALDETHVGHFNDYIDKMLDHSLNDFCLKCFQGEDSFQRDLLCYVARLYVDLKGDSEVLLLSSHCCLTSTDEIL